MFIKAIKKKFKNTNKTYDHLRLVESVRTPNGPRHKTVFHLGEVDIPKEDWKELANTIEIILTGQQNFLEPKAEIFKIAKYYATLIIKSRLNNEVNMENLEEKIENFQSVDVNSIKSYDTKTIGAEHVSLSAMKMLKFGKILKDIGFTKKQIEHSLSLVTARMCHPDSERESARWLRETSGTLGLLGSSNSKIYDTSLHKVAKLLWENKDVIENSLAKNTKKIFKTNENIILYDLTNTYFESSKKHSNYAKYGRSKEKRSDCPILTLALIVDADGFPKKSKIFRGNISEPTTLEFVLDNLPAEKSLITVPKTIVLDAGIATDANIELLKSKGLKYVAISRKTSYDSKFWQNTKDVEVMLNSGKEVLITRLEKTEEELFLRCFSPSKEAKSSSILKQKQDKFEEELTKLSNNLSKKGTQKKYEYILERIGRLKEKYKVGTLYNIKIEKDENKTKATKITFSKNSKGKAKESKTGFYVIRTNRLELNEESISKIHRSLTMIESSFRSMKSDLGLRPNYHRTDKASFSHIFITVLSYYFVSIIMKKLQEQRINHKWNTIRNTMLMHSSLTTTCNREFKGRLDISNSTEPSSAQKDIYKALEITAYPLKKRYYSSN